jgi:hypothetical protein
MIKFFTSIIDRIIFTLSFIAGVQAPEFIQQYVQRLSGHLDEAKFQLSQFQTIADMQFKGDLATLITRYQTNNDIAIQETGKIVNSTVERISSFEAQISQLQQNDYLNRLYYFAAEVDMPMAKATLENFKLAIPLEPEALITGAAFAFTLVLLLSALTLLVKSTAKLSVNAGKNYLKRQQLAKKSINRSTTPD